MTRAISVSKSLATYVHSLLNIKGKYPEYDASLIVRTRKDRIDIGLETENWCQELLSYRIEDMGVNGPGLAETTWYGKRFNRIYHYPNAGFPIKEMLKEKVDTTLLKIIEDLSGLNLGGSIRIENR